MHVDVWLYGPLARYGGEASEGSYAHLTVELPEGSTVGDLVERLGIPADERGITFVNNHLAALPGVEADLGIALSDGDRVGISHPLSMWPFQYRLGAQLTPELRERFRERSDQGIRHAYKRMTNDQW